MSELTPFHPLANQYPLLFGDAYDELVNDIREHGLIEPIVMYEGMILDGRNRHRACLDAGVRPRFTEYRGDSPEIFVQSKNEHRRHLSPVQLDEIRAGRRAKAVKLRGQGKSYRDIAEELGVSRQQAYRDVRQVSPDVTPDAITGADGKSYPATRRNGRGQRQYQEYEREYNLPIYDEGEGDDASWLDDDEPVQHRPHVAHNSGNEEWYTPPEYIEAARRAMGGLDTDPASSDTAQRWIQAATYYTRDDDGLEHDWHGRVWLNPPYSRGLVDRFASKLLTSIDAGTVSAACVLVNNATETAWFQSLLVRTDALCFVSGRVRFLDRRGNPGSVPLQGQVVLYFGQYAEVFARAFTPFGPIWRPAP